MTEWSQPDADGVQMLVEWLRPRRRVSGQRILRAASGVQRPRMVWSRDAIELLAKIVPSQASSRRWSVLQRIAGPGKVELLASVTRDLLRAGLITVRQQKLRAGEWQAHDVEFVEIAQVRELAGLPNLPARAQDAQNARGYRSRTPPACVLMNSLVHMRDRLAIRRSALARALDAWIEAGRSGTRYDFALFATGRTKGITKSDWEWLRYFGALEAASIVDHEPILMVAGRWTLHFHNGTRIDVGAHSAPIGIAASAIDAAQMIDGVHTWIVIENRTVFDRAARLGSHSAIIWTPGYSPIWWLRAVAGLLNLAPAKALIACDPDPAGIAIALRVARLWADRNISWQPAGMDAAALEALPRRWPLSSVDLGILDVAADAVRQTPLAGLHAVLPQAGKGEQEGYFDDTRLAGLLQRADA